MRRQDAQTHDDCGRKCGEARAVDQKERQRKDAGAKSSRIVAFDISFDTEEVGVIARKAGHYH
ncbi:hypothetical protein [Sphingomonas sp. PAMC 26605]|uniref:hypothetical protein n=1 Tax=Sphingomonas sp. PAMC 26605 TaxID=1112214 RepID=UPI0018DEECBD|nr:hypothetical protein [Sphingomonas sp. PAMC 26605]